VVPPCRLTNRHSVCPKPCPLPSERSRFPTFDTLVHPSLLGQGVTRDALFPYFESKMPLFAIGRAPVRRRRRHPPRAWFLPPPTTLLQPETRFLTCPTFRRPPRGCFFFGEATSRANFLSASPHVRSTRPTPETRCSSLVSRKLRGSQSRFRPRFQLRGKP
jgi:hypothetical protein